MYVGYEGWVAGEFKAFRDRTVAFHESQIALLDTCLERLEYNEKVKGGR